MAKITVRVRTTVGTTVRSNLSCQFSSPVFINRNINNEKQTKTSKYNQSDRCSFGEGTYDNR